MAEASSEQAETAMDILSAPPTPGPVRNEPRLMISRIVCKDFKSYAGIQSLGPFHKQFTSVIGPNGSGKSNVIDAVLFVFGNRARRIRCKKVSVLIHNSTQHQNLQSCSVSVHFQLIHDKEGDDYEVVPDSQFVISRTALKDNSSYYQINGKKVTFKEVAALLRESGIDIDHNRFLILQGEVEEIALLKPKAGSGSDDGMLEFLEDIVGSSQFKEPIEDLFKRFEDLSEERRSKLNRARAAEKEKKSLEGEKNDAEKYLGLQRTMSHKQYKLYNRYIYECELHEQKARKKKEELEAIAQSKEEKLSELQEQKKQKVKIIKRNQKAYEKLLEREESYKQQLTSCEQRDVHARQALKNAKANLKKLTKKQEKEKEKLVDLEAMPDRLSSEIKELEKKIVILEKRKVCEEERLAEVMQSLKTATQGIQKEKEGHELRLVDLNQTVNQVKTKLDVAKVELDICKERATGHERQVRETQESLQETRATIADRRKELHSIKTSLPSKKKELAKTQEELEKVTATELRLSKQLAESRAILQDGQSAFAEHRQKGHMLSALLEQKSNGTLPGIHGRLGDLGTIDGRYDVAISTACGPLDYIVTDTIDTAVDGIQFLKNQDLGIATFVGLDKMEHLGPAASKRITTPEGVPRLFDLVKLKDPIYRNVFYFALRDTLVAENLEQATRIGLQSSKRYRVVTLAGQLIDLSGTMSGGGTKVSKGRMSKKPVPDITPAQLAAIEKKFKEDEKLFEECRSQRVSLKERVDTLTSEVKEASENITKLEKKIELFTVKEEAIVGRIAELEAADSGRTKVDPEQLAGLERTVAQFTKQHKKAVEAADKVKTQVKKLHDKIMEVGGSRMQQQQAQVDAVCAEIDSSTTAITKATVSIKTNDRNLTKCQNLINSLDTELTDTSDKIEEVKGQLTALEDEAQEVLDKQSELKEECTVAYGALEELKKEMESVESEVTGIQTEMVDMRHELEQYSTKMRENHGKVKHFKNEIKHLDLGEEEPKALTETDLSTMDKKTAEYEITVLEEQLKQMTPNMAAIAEYKRKDEVHQARLQELDSVTAERDKTREEHDGLKKKRLDQFMAGFSAITNKLKEVYQMITLGGDAELELVDSLDPFSEGIAFSVRPPRKSWKNIVNLSGGEKTLSSLALVFALHHYKPSPFYVMDEIDAALDFKNVSIIAYYVKEQAKDAQFIIISLRDNMFEQADRLVGIYKTNDTTKSCAIDPRKIQASITAAAARPQLET